MTNKERKIIALKEQLRRARKRIEMARRYGTKALKLSYKLKKKNDRSGEGAIARAIRALDNLPPEEPLYGTGRARPPIGRIELNTAAPIRPPRPTRYVVETNPLNGMVIHDIFEAAPPAIQPPVRPNNFLGRLAPPPEEL